MKVWIVEGEHHSVPGIIVKVCASKTLADLEAVALVNIILNDLIDDEKIEVTVDNWEEELEDAKVAYVDHFNSMPRVEISEHEVIGS
ncbi:hypothetical protein FXV83_16160 [Bradyrhizobium hipponense]|uniref:Uncharacterized protein n=1 Tax=Bradyrhizobium hipponense TaxID=2605638 RepID=A0A5S4YMW4_9BRAD|nr:hypothetical protein [Bradyrhizobium hipponense]TYO65468.1 hypothetical protein FXV83_16160 [Bradyrhizobium hipponense]